MDINSERPTKNQMSLILQTVDCPAEKLSTSTKVPALSQFAPKTNQIQIPLQNSQFQLKAKLKNQQNRDLDYLYNCWNNMKTKEERVRFLEGSYFDRQYKINQSMRYQLIEWLCDISCDLKFQRQTFHLAANYGN